MVNSTQKAEIIDAAFKELNHDVLKKLLENSYDEISVVDANGILVYMNGACERNYNLKPEQIIGKKCDLLVEGGYWTPLLYPVVLKEKRRVTMEQVTVTGRKLVVTATPVFNENSEIEFIVWNSRDITEIEELKHDLAATKKMVSKYRRQVRDLRKKDLNFDGYIAYSKAMKECLDLANKVAAVDSTVLLTGESGTGKNVLAKFIHAKSQRHNGRLMSVNCAAIPEQLLESELFGYCGGAFTGADRNGKQGLVELANGGVLFLDEIGELPLGLQPKLLDLVQENSFIPVGGKYRKKVDIRIIAATNRKLKCLVKEGKFREDLYYRLNVIDIHLPALRERVEDIIPLLQHYLEIHDKKYKKSHCFAESSLDLLVKYTWPGNIRELANLVERLAVTVAETKIQPKHLSEGIRLGYSTAEDAKANYNLGIEGHFSLKEKENEIIMDFYKKLGSTRKVAEALNISQSKVSRTIRKLIGRT